MAKNAKTHVIPCTDLCSKEMFYKDPSDLPSEQDAVAERLYGACDTKVYWCLGTQTGRGPDDQPVNREACTKTDRPCYKGLDRLA